MSLSVLNRLCFFMARVKTAKNCMFDKHLFATNVGICVALSGVGDLIVQSYNVQSGKKREWDLTRTRNMSASGLTVGILCHGWYKFLDAKLPGNSIKIVIKKVIVDQIVFSPVCLTVFFLTIGILEQSSTKDILKEVVDKGKLLYAAEWVIWPPAQIINFYFLPTKYRVLYDNIVSLIYDIFTSHVKNDLES